MLQHGTSRVRRLSSPGRAIMVLAAGHAGWGLLAYHDALREILRARLVDTVGDGLVRKEHSRDARAAAFWFMAAAPAAWLTGYLVESALRAGDRRAVQDARDGRASVAARGSSALDPVSAMLDPRGCRLPS
jgi:hypothetical protein